MYDDNNVFAKILRKEIPCKPIYEDDKVFFFNDINPQAKIHILAIPKMQVTDYNDFILKADNEMIKYFFDKINEVAKEQGLINSGFRIVTNNGKDANQEVPHFHFHILGGENLKGIK
ncbi:histidine triad nucleotide-binding protein [Alphaproteobacteria bacterium]|nr:histidine triad nucleotide-binding protein [Alphaproteobacteria bacterium]